MRALGDYEGAVILISHDRHLVDATADRLWIVRDGTVKNYDGDMDSYRTLLLSERGTKPDAKSASAVDKVTRTDQRRVAAERRAELAPLRKKMTTAEQAVAKLSAEIAAYDEKLANPSLYEDAAKAQKLIVERAHVAKRLADAENDGLAATELYEIASAEQAT